MDNLELVVSFVDDSHFILVNIGKSTDTLQQMAVLSSGKKRKLKRQRIEEKKSRAHRSWKFDTTETGVADSQPSTSGTSAEEYVKMLPRWQLEKSLLAVTNHDVTKIQETAAAAAAAAAAAGGDPDGTPQPPAFCQCGNCVDMPTQLEQLCCRKSRGLCVTVVAEFATICLNRAVLAVALCYREDLLCLPEARTNDAMRHAAYRQFVYWRMGSTGKGRVVIPSCVVNSIRNSHPSENDHYTGFRVGAVSTIRQHTFD
ncbi:PREDICTED: P2X purinoceptor 7-like [Priapulus caudatus]|uniref:P2X purinoceptor 7-like n=1 Tax=Priapulus caudatus TaxID=37621 RepID=A0ABM1DS96_PRICU|nr:PREDICTED: P2X purinoceptor 7-like [Priapulus caudatus]